MSSSWFGLKPLVVITAFLGLIACGNSASENGSPSARQAALELGADSPEAVVARIRRAAENKDIRELAASTDPAQLGEMAEGLAFISAMILAFSALGDDVPFDAELKATELEAIFSRYGLPSMSDEAGPGGPASLQEALAGLEQVPMINLIADLGEFMDGLGAADEGVNTEFLPPFDGQLTDLVSDGTTASGRIGEESIEFVQVDRRWYARMPEQAQSSPGGMGAESFGSWDDQNRAGYENAIEIDMPFSFAQALDSNGRRWYRFTAPESGTFSLATRASGSNDGDLVIEAYVGEDFDFPVARSDADRDGDPANESIDVGLQAGEVIHVRVSQWGFGQSALSYLVDASFTPGEVAERSQGMDWSAAFQSAEEDHAAAAAGAVELRPGEHRQASLASGATHWYRITAPSAGTMILTTRGTGTDDGDLRLEAFRGSDMSSSVDYSDMDMNGDYAHEAVRVSLGAGEQMVVRVWAWAGGVDVATYQLHTEFVAD